jgi:uncharacterized protein with PIN domain
VVIDSSALNAILFDEPEAQSFLSQIATAEVCRLSTASLVEVGSGQIGKTQPSCSTRSSGP